MFAINALASQLSPLFIKQVQEIIAQKTKPQGSLCLLESVASKVAKT